MVRTVKLQTDSTTAYLNQLGDVFGDSTRRRIYRHVRQSDEPRSAGEVAEVFGLHRTVARAHLEKLCELGLVETSIRRRPTGGRPAKTYAGSAKRLEVVFPPRRYERLARLLLGFIDETTTQEEAAVRAEALGRAYGEDAAAALCGATDGAPARMTPAAVVEWMNAAGYGATLEVNGVVVVEVHNCVYSELSLEYPHVVCPFDRGMLLGMLGVDAGAYRQTQALSAGDDVCRHEISL